MAIKLTPRIGTSFRTPVGNVYVGGSFRSSHPHTAPQPQQQQQHTAQQRGCGPAPVMRPTHHTGPRLTLVRPNFGGVILISLAMLIMATLALVAMVLLAVGTGIMPMASPSSYSTPTHTGASVSVSQGHTAPAPTYTSKG
jgi:hypothetical protein